MTVAQVRLCSRPIILYLRLYDHPIGTRSYRKDRSVGLHGVLRDYRARN
jgi:hypothetical protein